MFWRSFLVSTEYGYNRLGEQSEYFQVGRFDLGETE
jgi:hypothetical protein